MNGEYYREVAAEWSYLTELVIESETSSVSFENYLADQDSERFLPIYTAQLTPPYWFIVFTGPYDFNSFYSEIN